MSENNIRQKVHQVVDQTTSSAKPDPWLAQKVRSRAQEREKEPMRKKVPAGLVIVIAVMLLMTAVAAAVTNGFGLLWHYPEQADNTAFTDRIVSIGQTWEGEYFSAEIKEAVFDGYKLRFSMGVTPKEGAEGIFAYPVVKAVCEGKELETSLVAMSGWADGEGFWVPELIPPIPREDFDLNDMVYEVSLMDSDFKPSAVNGDVEWTITFNVLHTDWKISFGDTYFDDEWEEKYAAFEKLEYEAYDRHELLLDAWGYGMDRIIEHAYMYDDTVHFIEDFETYMLTLYTRDVFVQEEQAVFTFVADRAEVRKAKVPVKFVLPEKQKFEVTKAEATADGVCVTIHTKYYHAEEIYESDIMPWTFTLKTDDAELSNVTTCTTQGWDDYSKVLELTIVLEADTNKPVSSVTLVPAERVDSWRKKREDLAIVLELE